MIRIAVVAIVLAFQWQGGNYGNLSITAQILSAGRL